MTEMTVSQKQLEANRQNAKKGGIKTAEGRAIAKFNALKHGLLAKEAVLTVGEGAEDPAEFEAVAQDLKRELKPQGVLEEVLVEKIVVAYFGGVRWWFICLLSYDGVYCGRRVAKLYCPPGGIYYGCRHCYNLSYDSRNEPRSGRFAVFGKILDLDRQQKKLREQTRRLIYQGRPTKKARRLSTLRSKMDHYCRIVQAKGYISRDNPTPP